MFTILHYGKKKDVGICQSKCNRIKAGKQCIRPNIMHEGRGQGDTHTHTQKAHRSTHSNKYSSRPVAKEFTRLFSLKQSAADNLRNVLLY